MLERAGAIFGINDDSEWRDILVRSVTEPIINGFEMPRFPHGSIQRQFVGSCDEAALNEGFTFYKEVKNIASQCNLKLSSDSRYLDFGCGWGRYARYFWNDIAWDNISGVDIDPEIIHVCKALKVPGNFHRIDPNGILPFKDNSFDLITAYSVFSHLPEKIAHHWIQELSRTIQPGGLLAFTTEPRRFLDFIEKIDGNASSSWHQTLYRYKNTTDVLKSDFDQGKFVYIPTGGGNYRDAEIYGEACIPEIYIKNNWNTYFKIIKYIDDPTKFWQAFVVLQKQ